MAEPRTAVFISDVHLQGVDDPRTRPFSDFLRSWAGKVDAVFLVGDVFDFYYGFKSVVYWEHLPALSAIDDLVRAGTQVVFVEGNHEFRIAEAFRGAFGIQTFAGEGEVRLAGKRVLLCHGDLADPNDRGYRFLHWALRNPLTASLGAMVPPSVAMAVARLASDGSRAYAGGRADRLTTLFRERAKRAIAEGFDVAVFGHSHAPVLETLDVSGRSGLFANCGDWVRHFTYLRFDGERLTLEQATPPPNVEKSAPV